jgi:hypothetical protein
VLEQKAIDRVSQVTTYLKHPGLMRFVYDAGDDHASGGEIDDEQHMKTNQARPRDRLDSEEVHRRDGTPVRTQEGAPRCALAAFGGGNHAGVEQDALARVAPDLVPEVEQRAADARVAPDHVVSRHAQDELDDVRVAPRLAAVASSRSSVFARDQATVPTPQSVWRDQGVESPQRLAAELVRRGCEPAALGVCVRYATTAELLAQHCISASRYSVTRWWSRVIHPATVISRNCSGRLDMTRSKPHRSSTENLRGFNAIHGWHRTR